MKPSPPLSEAGFLNPAESSFGVDDMDMDMDMCDAALRRRNFGSSSRHVASCLAADALLLLG